MAALQAELAQAQQEQAKQHEKVAAYEEQRQQIYWELRKLQGSQEQSKQRVSVSPAFPQRTGACARVLSLPSPLCATGRSRPSRTGCSS